MITVDTNIIGYLYIDGPYTPKVEQALEKDSEWIAPFLWRSELMNVLAIHIRQNMITLEEANIIIDKATSLMSGKEYEASSSQVLALAKQSQCSSYDCEFVALAEAMNVPLVTMDKQIVKKFPDTAISLIDFVGD
ncbi:MAG: type II toxin-antitoxin system VapC family toxin [Chloroflexota bacterium]